MVKSFPHIQNAELFLAGGAVRDTLLGKEPKDRDFVILTDMTFDETVKAIESNPRAKVFLAKPEFFTIRCMIDNEPIDIAFPRDENSYTDGRHPDNVKRVDTLLEDAKRRDFTINAMYMRENGEIIDYFNGQTDLKNEFIQCVGDANQRFSEDALRIFRAIRFSVVLGFDISYTVKQAIWKNKDLLNAISAERMREEINKCLLKDPARTFELLDKYWLFDILEAKGLTFELTMKER